jgi:hypothetical protein
MCCYHSIEKIGIGKIKQIKNCQRKKTENKKSHSIKRKYN